MIPLIHDNYLQGTGNGPTWNVSISPPKRKIKSYFNETLDVAEYIYANRTGKIHLLYSGGMDSEFVFNIFLKLGIEFTPVIIKLNPNYNDHDLAYALSFCESKNIKPIIVDVDFNHFVSSGKIVDIAEKIKCAGYQIPVTMHVANQLDGFIVLGNDPPYMKLNTASNTWQLEELELIHSILNNFRINRLEGCPFFLSYTPEMMLSFLLEPRMVELANHIHPGKLGTNTSKIHVYNNNTNFNMVQRPKYTGYENIENSKIFQHENLTIFKEFQKMWGGAYYENYHELIKRLSCNQ